MQRTSVIIPVYNGAKVIARALQSVIVQSSPPYEVIVVNDGSSDATEKIAKETCSDAIVIPQENRGAGAARNTGIRVAKGEWIAFLDCDDEWRSDKLERQHRDMQDFSEAVLVYGKMRDVLADGSAGRVWPELVTMATNRSSISQHWAGLAALPPTSTAIARRDALVKAGLFAEDIATAEDIDLWVRLLGEGGFVGNDTVLADRYLRPESLTHLYSAVSQYERYLQVAERQRRTIELWAGKSAARCGRRYIRYLLANAHYRNGSRLGQLNNAFLSMLGPHMERNRAAALMIEAICGSWLWNRLRGALKRESDAADIQIINESTVS